jgi:hypothetical protein
MEPELLATRRRPHTESDADSHGDSSGSRNALDGGVFVVEWQISQPAPEAGSLPNGVLVGGAWQ